MSSPSEPDPDGRNRCSEHASEASTPKAAGREIAKRERSEHAEGGGGRGREASLGGLRPPKQRELSRDAEQRVHLSEHEVIDGRDRAVARFEEIDRRERVGAA